MVQELADPVVGPAMESVHDDLKISGPCDWADKLASLNGFLECAADVRRHRWVVHGDEFETVVDHR